MANNEKDIYHIYAPQDIDAETETDRAIKDSQGNIIDTTYATIDSVSDLHEAVEELSESIASKADLDENGKVPMSQLSDDIHDVEEYASRSEFPSTGDVHKIYIAKDANVLYYWNDGNYTLIDKDKLQVIDYSADMTINQLPECGVMRIYSSIYLFVKAPGVNKRVSLYIYNAIIGYFKFGNIKNMTLQEFFTTSDKTFNVTDVQVAKLYDSSSIYSAGEYCWHDDVQSYPDTYERSLYRCKQDIDEPEEWNSQHWIKTTICDELVNPSIMKTVNNNSLFGAGNINTPNDNTTYQITSSGNTSTVPLTITFTGSDNTQTQISNIMTTTYFPVMRSDTGISICTSYDTIPSDGAVAIGYHANAAAQYTTAIGHIAKASSTYAVSIGCYANAHTQSSTAIGYGTIANGISSTAIGHNANASGNSSTAIGYNANAEAKQSFAIGNDSHTMSNASGSTAIGNGAKTNGQYCGAFGDYAFANADQAYALAHRAKTSIPLTVIFDGHFDNDQYIRTLIFKQPSQIFFTSEDRSETNESYTSLSQYANGHTLQELLDSKQNKRYRHLIKISSEHSGTTAYLSFEARLASSTALTIDDFAQIAGKTYMSVGNAMSNTDGTRTDIMQVTPGANRVCAGISSNNVQFEFYAQTLNDQVFEE